MASRVIAAIDTAIGMSDSNVLQQNLNVLPLSQMTPEKQDFFLHRLLRQAAEKRASPEISQIIYSKWVELNTDEENNPILPKIIYEAGVEELRVFLNNLGFNFYSCIISLSSYFHGPLVTEVLYKLDQIFGTQIYDIYKDLFNYLEPREDELVIESGKSLDEIASALIDENSGKKLMETQGLKVKSTFSDYLYEYLIEKMKLTAPVAERPQWILAEKETFTPEDLNSDIMLNLPDPETAADLILNNMKTLGVINENDILKSKVLIFEMYKNSPGFVVKLNLLLPVYIDIFLKNYDDDELIRHYGPLNPFIASSETGVQGFNINSRMFESTHYEVGKLEGVEGFDEDEDIRSWFTENCQVCRKKILSYHYAVRMPMPGGGWRGCYDSWMCVGKDLPKNIGDVEKNLNDRQIQGHLIRYFNSLLKRVGIYDRDIEESLVEYENPREKYEENTGEMKRQMELAFFQNVDIPEFKF